MSSPQLKILESPSDIKGLIDYLADKDLVAYDTETTGVTSRDEIIGLSICAEEDIAYYVILAAWSPEQQALVRTPGMREALLPLIQQLSTKQLIMHNAVFDCMITNAFFKVQLIDSVHTDTMILAHLLDENRKVGLKELARSILGEASTTEARLMKESVAANGGSLKKDNYEMYKADPMLLAKYGAKDAQLTYRLFMHLVPELYEQGLDKFFYEEESMPLLRGPTFEMNTTGNKVDLTKLAALKATLISECAEAKDFIHQEIGPYVKAKYGSKFNIGSSQQLGWLLFGELGLEFGTLTKGGKEACRALGLKLPYTAPAKREFIAVCLESVGNIYAPEGTVNGKKVKAKKVKEPWAYIMTDKKTLTKLAPRYKWIERLLEYQRKMKLLSTYVKGIEARTQYGVIQPSFLQHGTTSGRYSCKNPNWQNLPRDDKRVKDCVVARPGRIFVGADYSQLEPRVFAYVSGDQRLKDAFASGNDFYSVIGMDTYGAPPDTVPLKDGHPKAFGALFPKLRQDSKVFCLAATYGATGFQLGPLMGKSSDAAQADVDAYFESFPAVRQMMLDSHELAKKQGFVLNAFGRPRRMPDAMKIPTIYGNTPHEELPYEARSLLNLAVNHRIQSTAASIVNRSMIRLYNNIKQLSLDAKIVGQIHDSITVECAEMDGDTILILLQDAMENTTILEGVILEAIPKKGYRLSEV